VGALVVETKQDALDYLTWTFLYRRLPQNPNFYNLRGTSHRHLSDFLSELVDGTLADLEASQCVAIADDVNLAPLNLGMIAAFYYLRYTTVEIFASTLSAKSRAKALLEAAAAAAEFDDLPVRAGDERALRALAAHLPLALPAPAAGAEGSMYADPHTKANVLLQAHFTRVGGLSAELRGDQARVVAEALPLAHALVDVAAAEGWLKPALAAMELSQMLLQAVLVGKDSALLQVPHLDRAAAAALEAREPPVESVFDLIAMEPAARAAALALPPAALADVARFCNRFPNVDVAYELAGGSGAAVAGEPVPLVVALRREASTEGMDEGAGIGAVIAPHFPKPKAEGWWLVVGDKAANRIYAIKKTTLAAAARVKLDFPAPAAPGKHKLTLFFMADSYIGADQEYDFDVNVAAAATEGGGERMVE
jgi:pre-mRNA-splicing helicase BRR2